MAATTSLVCPLCGSPIQVLSLGASYQCEQGHFHTELGLELTLRQKMYATLLIMIREAEAKDELFRPLITGGYVSSNEDSILPTLYRMLDELEGDG